MAEGVGFEPTFAKKAKAVFKTATISHSVTPPIAKFQLLLNIMLQVDVKVTVILLGTPFLATGKTSSNNAIASDCIPSIIWE